MNLAQIHFNVERKRAIQVSRERLEHIILIRSLQFILFRTSIFSNFDKINTDFTKIIYRKVIRA